jgi:pimeloyl-ACP methyl ester carboxylesterase
MIGQEVSFKSGDVKLAGTLCLPSAEGSFPCVLMIHGSGPLDRNENARGFPLNAFNTIARHLADKGIDSLRYDKRGIGRSGGSYWDAGFYDFIQDAKAAHDYLASHEHIKKDMLFLLGHSEGGYIAPKISLTYTSIAGLILIAATVQRLEKVLLAQSAILKKDVTQGRGFKRGMIKFGFKLFGDPETTQTAVIQKIKGTKKAWFRHKGQRVNAKWFREIMEYDPVYTVQNVTCPVLAISGEKDIQVDPQDAANIAEMARGEVEHHIIPNMTHLLRLDYGTPSLLEYKRLLKRDIDRSMLDIMVTWLQRIIVSK